MGECWLCHRSYEEAQTFISEQIPKFRQFMLEEGKKKSIAPVCSLCRYVLKTLFMEFKREELEKEMEKLLQERDKLLSKKERQ